MFTNKLKPTWCKGCSYFGVRKALSDALQEMNITPTAVNIFSGIGCSSRLPLWMNTFGLHGVHGRAIPIAIGSRIARSDIPVIVVGGDGDLFSIGIGHFVHAARKNFNLTVLCMDNRCFAMTKNQASPTSPKGYIGTYTPYGKLSEALNVIEFAISSEVTFVAQSHVGNLKHLTDIVVQGLHHEGFSFINIIAPCRLHHPKSDLFEKNNYYDINNEYSHDPSDKKLAVKYALNSIKHSRIDEPSVPVGIFWRNTMKETFEQGVAELHNREIKKSLQKTS